MFDAEHMICNIFVASIYGYSHVFCRSSIHEEICRGRVQGEYFTVICCRYRYLDVQISRSTDLVSSVTQATFVEDVIELGAACLRHLPVVDVKFQANS
jgi:hypothetical protein